MKEHLLNPSDRAALQSLVPLAGALGVGTIFALFFGGRRRAGLAVFELFAIVAVLTGAGTTAYFCISLLHRNTPITDAELTQTATPLLVAAMLLVFVSVFARLPRSGLRILVLFPLALVGVVIAALLASSTWTAGPENASLVALAILAVGALLAACAWAADRWNVGSDRQGQVRRLLRLSRAGYAPAEGELRLALPQGDAPRPPLAVWDRKGRTYLDPVACLHLREQGEARWHELAEGNARPPVDAPALVRARLSLHVPPLTSARSLELVVLDPGATETRILTVAANDDGLFDVTELGVV